MALRYDGALVPRAGAAFFLTFFLSMQHSNLQIFIQARRATAWAAPVLALGLGLGLLPLGAALAQSAAAPSAAAQANAVVASGPAGTVTAAQLETAVTELVPERDREKFWATPAAVTRFARSLYVQHALAAQARQAKLDQTPEGVALVALKQEQALMELSLRRAVGDVLPNDAALKQYARSEYQAKPERYTRPEEVRVRHILLAVAKDGSDDEAVKARAEALRAQVQQGADFAKLAAENSSDQSNAARGGDLGFFARGKMAKAFDDAAFGLAKPGDVSALVRTQFGYHIIQLEDRKAATLMPFDEAYPLIREEVRTAVTARERGRVWEAEDEKAQVQEPALQAVAGRHVTVLPLSGKKP